MSLRILSINKSYRPKGGATIYLGEMGSYGGRPPRRTLLHEGRAESALDYDHFFVDNVNCEKPGLGNKIIASSKILYCLSAQRFHRHDQESFDIAHLHNIYHQLSPSILGVPEAKYPGRREHPRSKNGLWQLQNVCKRRGVRAPQRWKHYQLLLNRCTKGSLAELVNTLEMFVPGHGFTPDRPHKAVSHFY